VQKPAKTELRLDAAQRAYREVLAGVADGALAVDIVADPIKGSVAVIKLSGVRERRPELEAMIAERMKPFPVAYTVEWTG